MFGEVSDMKYAVIPIVKPEQPPDDPSYSMGCQNTLKKLIIIKK